MKPYSKSFIIGKELTYIEKAVKSDRVTGDGMFTKKCPHFFEQKYNFPN